jgi:hypothetical protein
MTGTLWSRKRRGLLVAIAAVVAYLSIGLVHPKPTFNAALGAEWQCSKTVGVLTVCTKVLHAQPLSDHSRKDPVLLDRA